MPKLPHHPETSLPPNLSRSNATPPNSKFQIRQTLAKPHWSSHLPIHSTVLSNPNRIQKPHALQSPSHPSIQRTPHQSTGCKTKKHPLANFKYSPYTPLTLSHRGMCSSRTRPSHLISTAQKHTHTATNFSLHRSPKPLPKNSKKFEKKPESRCKKATRDDCERRGKSELMVTASAKTPVVVT